MVYRRRVVKRRRRFQKKGRSMTKQMLKPMIRGRVRQPVHYFTRFQDGGTIVAATSTTTTFATFFLRLQDIPGYTEFQAMYDFYKINAVQVRFIPLFNSSDGSFNVNEYSTRIATVIDYNDDGTPTSMNDLRQRENCKISPYNKIHKRFFHPKPIVAIDEDAGSGTNTGFGQTQKTPWVSCASDAVQWHGLKMGIQHPSASTYSLYVIEYKVYLAFKGKL